MESVEIADLYQASYLLMSGCRLEGIKCSQDGGPLTCKMSFSGNNLQPLVMNWFEKKAVVNLWAFRGAYSQVCNHVHQAKRDYAAERRASAQEAAR
jgi:hypothetical protein